MGRFLVVSVVAGCIGLASLPSVGLAQTVLQTYGLSSAPHDVAITPDGTRAVVRAGGAPTDAITVYDLGTGAELARFGSNSAGPVVSDAVEVTNSRAVTLGAAGATDSVRIFNLTSNPPTSLQTFGLSSAPYDVAITPDGTKAVVRAGGTGDGITVYDLATGVELASFGSNSGPVGYDAAEATNSRAVTLGAAGATDSVRILDLTTNPPTSLQTFSLSSAPGDVAITPDGTKAVVRAGGTADAITVYDLTTGTQLASFGSNSSPGGPSTDGAVDAIEATNTRAIALGGAGATDSVRILDLTTNPPTSLQTFGLSSAPYDLAITPDGTKAVVRAGGTGDGITVYDLANGAELASFGSNSSPGGAAETDDARDAVEATNTRAITLGGAGATDSVRILDLTTNPPTSLQTFGLSSAPYDVAITPDGTKAVVRAGGTGDGITVYDLAAGAELASFGSNSGPVGADAVEVTNSRAVTLGAAGETVAAGATDSVRVLRLSQAPTGRPAMPAWAGMALAALLLVAGLFRTPRGSLLKP